MIISVRIGNLGPNCPESNHSCPSLEKSGGFIAFMFALYMVALGAGCLRPCLATLGADQFDIEDPEEKKQIRSYFNWFFFSMSVGAMIAMMVVVYVAESISWFWSFTIMGTAMLLSTACLVAGAGYYRHKKPQGSPLTRIAQVIVAASRKKRIPPPSDSAMLFEVHDHENGVHSAEPTLKRFNSNKGEVLGEPTLKRYYSLPHTKGLGFLDKAAIVTDADTGAQSAAKVNPWRLCTITQVEELKTMMRCFPIAFIASFLYIVVAQIQTWAVAEGYTMKRTIGKSFSFPPPSLSAISVAFVLVEIAVYDRWFVPFMRKYTNHSHGITHLQRIGLGLIQSILAMAYGAVIETARLRSASHHGLTNDPAAIVPISIFWLLPMWILASSAELFAYVGCFEFFWQEMPVEMRSLGGGLSLLAIALGFYQSGGLIVVTNAVSKSDNGGWLADANLNKNHLNYFYIILMVLSIFNTFGFYMSTKWYNYVKFINTKTAPAETPIPDMFRRSESRVPLKLEAPEELKNRGAAGHQDEFKNSKGGGGNEGGNRGGNRSEEDDPVAVPDCLPRSESRTPLRSTNNSDDLPQPLPWSPRTIFSHVFSPPVAAAQKGDVPRFIKLERSRSTRAQSK